MPRRRCARWKSIWPLACTAGLRFLRAARASAWTTLIVLDANVLFATAYGPDTGLWRVPGARPITSVYAAEEACRNLSIVGQRRELEELLGSVRGRSHRCLYASPAHSSHGVVRQDRVVLVAAIAVGATHLLTADIRHFCSYIREANRRGSRFAAGRTSPFENRIVRGLKSYDPLG